MALPIDEDAEEAMHLGRRQQRLCIMSVLGMALPRPRGLTSSRHRPLAMATIRSCWRG